jgi:hypothetical protein
MVRMLSATAIVASLMITPAAPTLAAAPSSQCLHAQCHQTVAGSSHPFSRSAEASLPQDGSKRTERAEVLLLGRWMSGYTREAPGLALIGTASLIEL